MNINTLTDNIAEAVAGDSGISSWSNTNYSTDHTVFINVDGDDLPGSDYCPYVIVVPDRKAAGQRTSQREHTVDVICCISDDSTRAHAGYTNIVDYQGSYNLEAFRKLVETAIVGVDVGNGTVDFELEFDTISVFPLMWCFMRVLVLEPVTMGSDYLA